MKKKVMIGICVLLAIVLLVPIPMRLKDGGTVVYRAVLYQVEDVHRPVSYTHLDVYKRQALFPSQAR